LFCTPPYSSLAAATKDSNCFVPVFFVSDGIVLLLLLRLLLLLLLLL
jgi:hypothetical protein